MARIWKLSWWWKGPLLTVLAIFLIAVIGFALTRGNDKKSNEAAVVQTDSSTTATPSTRATLTAPATGAATSASTQAPTQEPAAPPTSTPPPAPTSAPLDQVAAVPGAVGEGENVRVTFNAEQDPWNSENPSIKPDPGTRWVSFDVTIENLSSSDTHSVNPHNFTLSDIQNTEYPLSFFGPEPRLHGAELLLNQNTRGWVTFEVNEVAQLQRLSYRPNPSVDAYIEFVFS